MYPANDISIILSPSCLRIRYESSAAMVKKILISRRFCLLTWHKHISKKNNSGLLAVFVTGWITIFFTWNFSSLDVLYSVVFVLLLIEMIHKWKIFKTLSIYHVTKWGNLIALRKQESKEFNLWALPACRGCWLIQNQSQSSECEFNSH